MERKTKHVPQIRVQSGRHARYREAHAVRMRENPDLSWSDWIREALDEKAERDLRG
jgi:hypothetical protein